MLNNMRLYLRAGWLGGKAWAVSTQGNFKRRETGVTWDPGPGVNDVLTACVVGGVGSWAGVVK